MSYLDFLEFWQLPTELVEDIKDLNKPKGNKPPTPPGPGAANAPGAGEAMMMQQKMDAAKERMEFDQNQKAMKKHAAEIEAEQDLLMKAEQEVADDLNDQFSDKDDVVKFYPQFESFRAFTQRQPLSEDEGQGRVPERVLKHMWDYCMTLRSPAKREYALRVLDKSYKSNQKNIDWYKNLPKGLSGEDATNIRQKLTDVYKEGWKIKQREDAKYDTGRIRLKESETKCVVCGKSFDPSESGDKDFCVDDLDQKRD